MPMGTQIPTELGYLRDATRFYLAMLRDLEPVLADIEVEVPTYAQLAHHLEAAQRDAMGTPTGIAMELARLLGLSE